MGTIQSSINSAIGTIGGGVGLAKGVGELQKQNANQQKQMVIKAQEEEFELANAELNQSMYDAEITSKLPKGYEDIDKYADALNVQAQESANKVGEFDTKHPNPRSEKMKAKRTQLSRDSELATKAYLDVVKQIQTREQLKKNVEMRQRNLEFLRGGN